jgi:hypothetical protein
MWILTSCNQGSLMGTRVFDATLVGLIFSTLLFLGSVFLLIDIPIFNPVNPFSLAIAYLGLCLGLVFGLFAGRWYTREQLKILTTNNEFRGLGSRKIRVIVFGGSSIFLLFELSIIYLKASALVNSLALFIFSATFTMFVIRMILLISWEKHERKIVMAEWNKFYVIPYPPEF